MSATPDVLVVGAGAAGGRVALELARAGARVVVLEAGPEYPRHAFPLPEIDMLTRLYWNAGLELSREATVVFTRGKGVGGSTLVNQALLDRFDESILSGWRDASGVELFTAARMGPLYDRAESDLQVATIGPARFNGNSTRVARAFSARGIAWHGLRRGEGAACRTEDCMACLGGCPHESKQGSAVTTLREARRLGAEVWAGWHVDAVHERGGQVEVHARGPAGVRRLQAGEVVLAAGSLGTPAIGFRSGWLAHCPRLGEGFTCHPQFLTAGLLPDQVDAHRGAFQGVASSDPRFLARGYKFESSFVPPIVFHAMFQGGDLAPHALSALYRHLVCIEICLRDDVPGRLRPRRDGGLHIDRDLGATDRERWHEAVEVLKGCYETLGASRVLVSRKAFSVHPMGGCGLADTPVRGVVGPDFRVFGHRRVRVADASLFPAAPGRNPSLTVMALATAAADAIRSAA